MTTIKFVEVPQDEATNLSDIRPRLNDGSAGAHEEYIDAVRRVSGLDLSAGVANAVNAKRQNSVTLIGNAQAGVIEATRRIR